MKQVILRGICASWDRILHQTADAGGNLSIETEPAITARLEVALNAILGEEDHPSRFSGSIFQNVVRGAEIPNFNDQALEKRPDLTFRLIAVEPGVDRSLYALFVECKIVGPVHPVASYVNQGILRFIVGDYAWAMPSGMMLAYSHPGFTVSGSLIPHLQLATKGGMVDTSTPPCPCPDLSGDQLAYESSHGRSWTYPRQGTQPGRISLLHLWLPLPS